jgi:F-type H+-transporting ATPase subunit epsilon
VSTPEQEFYNGEADSITLETNAGKIQILPRHISYFSGIVPGVMKIKDNENIKKASVSGGFVHFSNDRALVFVDKAQWEE